MNNKKLGNAFEREMVQLLSDEGFWVHFIEPNRSGAQPFDIIAVKDGIPVVGDCKTSSKKTISISRLEDNQIMAFDKWISCGNEMAFIFVKYDDKIYAIPYWYLCKKKKVTLDGFLRVK